MKTDNTNKFIELFSELEDCNEEEQKQKIIEMNEFMERMGKEELYSVLEKELFNKIHIMIKEKKISVENALFLLKHIGYRVAINNIILDNFLFYSLGKRFLRMIIKEDHKKEKKNENLLTDLCECYAFLFRKHLSELIPINIPCFLKVALNKAKSEEVQKDVEIALVALSRIENIGNVNKELYLNEIKEIIQYHQGHHNLTHLAYQSVWQFLIRRFSKDICLEGVIAYKLHFMREAIGEMEELTRCAVWKRKEDEKEKRRVESREVITLIRWFEALNPHFIAHRFGDGEFLRIVVCVVGVFHTVKDYLKEIGNSCINFLKSASMLRYIDIDHLLKSGVVDVFLEEITLLNVDRPLISCCLSFFKELCQRFNYVTDESERDEAKQIVKKRTLIEKMEEEGYEDCIFGLCHYLCEGAFGNAHLLQNCEYYFVYC